MGGWSDGGAVGDVWRAGHFTCLLGLGGGGVPLGGSRKFPHQAGTERSPRQDSIFTLIIVRSHETLPFFLHKTGFLLFFPMIIVPPINFLTDVNFLIFCKSNLIAKSNYFLPAVPLTRVR